MTTWIDSVLAVLIAASIAAIVHAYAVYPLSLWTWRWLSRRKPTRPPEPADWPRVAMLASAYNEATGISDKLENFFDLDYPPEKLILWLGDDKSADDTLALAKQAAGGSERIHIVAFDKQRGKVSVISDLAERARIDADIFIMSDATSLHARDMVKKLVRWLQDPNIGVAGATLEYLQPETGEATGEGLYWRLERFMRQTESDLGGSMQPSGAGYALRAEDFRPMPPDTLCDDFHLPLAIMARGKAILTDESARMAEYLADDQQAEFKRRVRIGMGNYQILWRFRRLLWPRNIRLWYMYMSHKVLRWLGPFFMLIAWLGCIPLLGSGIVCTLFAIQSTGYGLVALSALFPALRRRFGPIGKIINLGYYFCLINLALLVGFFKLLATRPDGRWEKA